MPFAISPGVVSHDVPSLTEPSGMVTLMGTRGCLAISSSCFALRRLNSSSRSWRKEGGGFSSSGPESSVFGAAFLSFFAPLAGFGAAASAMIVRGQELEENETCFWETWESRG